MSALSAISCRGCSSAEVAVGTACVDSPTFVLSLFNKWLASLFPSEVADV